jgi:hypothetical protein
VVQEQAKLVGFGLVAGGAVGGEAVLPKRSGVEFFAPRARADTERNGILHNLLIAES